MSSSIVHVLVVSFFVFSSLPAFAIDTFGRSSSPNPPIAPYGESPYRGHRTAESRSDVHMENLFKGGLTKFSLQNSFVLVAPEIDEKPILVEVNLDEKTARLTGSEQVETRVRVEFSEAKNNPDALIIEAKENSLYKELILDLYSGRHGLLDRSGQSVPAVGFWVNAERQFAAVYYGGQEVAIKTVMDVETAYCALILSK